VDIAFLEKLDLKTFERACGVLFDQMGFIAKSTGMGAMPGIGEVMVLYSKSSNAPFALLQCAEIGARVEVDQLQQVKNSMTRQALNNGYFVTVGTTGLAANQFAAANKINLIDGVKFVELVNKLPENGRTLLRQALATERAPKSAETVFGTGSYPKLAGTAAKPTVTGPRPAGSSGPPTCAKCGSVMRLQVKRDGQYQTGKFWQCPNQGCGYISAYFEPQP